MRSTNRQRVPLRLAGWICFVLACMAGFSDIAESASVRTYISYKSSVSSDASGPLDLWAEINYDNARQNVPIVVVMHGYSPAYTFNDVRANAERLRDNGFFAVSVAMRNRDGSDGVRDSGGVEIFDIYDAVEKVKKLFPAYVDETNISITGYSGGGGNVMSSLTKFPDYFRAGSGYFGMSDYGYDSVNGWFFRGAGSGHRAQMIADIGDPTTGNPDVMDRYAARASNLASKNNPYSEIHLFVNYSETTCPMVNDTTYRDNAVANESFPGEFDNIYVHIGGYGDYEDFNNNGINEADELQSWPHGFPNESQQHAAESWYLERLRSGQIAEPVLNDADELYVAGYVKTKKFFLWLGDGQNAAADLGYSFESNEIDFEMQILTNNKSVSGRLEMNTDYLSGEYLSVFLNGEVIDHVIGGQTAVIPEFGHGDHVHIVATLEGDINCDGEIDLRDFSLFSLEWQRECCPCNGADINKDNQVNLTDLAGMIENWFNGKRVVFHSNPLDSDPGWETQGGWEFGVPAGIGGLWHGSPDPTEGASGNYVYGVNLFGDYLPAVSGPYSLVAGPFDCQNYDDVHLIFARWLNTDEPDYIRSRIEYSLDGQEWETVWEHEGHAAIEDSDWREVDYALGSGANNQSQVYIRWVYEVIHPRVWPYSGWNIDDIRLSGVFKSRP